MTNPTARIFDHRRCDLGEGPLWHHDTQTLYWVDILRCAVLWRGPNGAGERLFDRPVSALAAAQDGSLLAADDRELFLWSVDTDRRNTLVSLEADLADNRANDGRADPWGGFWIGTMEREAKTPQGSIYRWYRGELRRIVNGISISNGICFDRLRRCAYYTDTPTHRIFRITCDDAGWPVEDPVVHIDLAADRILIDGAATDLGGNLRAACWDLGAVLTISPQGQVVDRLTLPTMRPTCTVFGGPDGRTLFITSAAVGQDDDRAAGKTYCIADPVGGPPTPTVLLD